MKCCGNDLRGSESSQPALTAPAAAGRRAHIPRIPLVIPGSDLLGATQQFPSPARKSAPRTEYQGAHLQGWPQETEQLNNHDMNHQPGIPKGSYAPPLCHMGICTSRDVRDQAGLAAHLQPTGTDTHKLGMDMCWPKSSRPDTSV